jgi:nicotinate phosphoribosyltransferase
MEASLLIDLYELTMAQCYFAYKRKTWATFELFVRELPQNRSYLVAAGLEDILGYINNLKFDRGALAYLKKQGLFSPSFLKYLSNFKFSGNLWAMREGEIFFAQEPVIRVTAPLIEAQIIESFLLNTVHLQAMIASKASRVVTVAAGRSCFDFALRRTHGQDAGIKVARSSYIAGFSGTSCVLAGKRYNIPIAGTMAHSFIMSFKNEPEAFLAYTRSFPTKSILLVDTYNTKKGIANAIAAGLLLKQKGERLRGIRLDSGDIVSLSKLARRMLDAAGLDYVKIFASGNLDEFKINDLLKKGACVDNFGVGTHMGTSEDAPSLDVIYKICEVSDGKGRFFPTMKLSRGKGTYPGRKQIFRIQDRRKRFTKDVLGLEREKIIGRPLLIKAVANGRVIYRPPSLDKARDLTRKNLTALPGQLKAVRSRYKYPVVISPQLKKLRIKLSVALKKKAKG